MHTTANRGPGDKPLTFGAAPLPPRVRRILSTLHKQAADTLTPLLDHMLDEFETALSRQGPRTGGSSRQPEQFIDLRVLRDRRGELLRRFLAGLESELAAIRGDGGAPTEQARAATLQFSNLSLVEDVDLERDILLGEISQREVLRSRDALEPLGQRFGVLAASPALEHEKLPLGPHALSRILREAGEALHVGPESQLILYRTFEQSVLSHYGELAGLINASLSEQGVLPGLTYLPPRLRTLGREGDGRPRADASGDGNGAAADARPLTDWYGAPSAAWTRALFSALLPAGSGMETAVADPASAPDDAAAAAGAHSAAGHAQGHALTPEQEQAMMAALQQLLEQRAAATGGYGQGVAVPTDALLAGLGALQEAAAATTASGAKPPRRSLAEMQQALLRHVRAQHGADATLGPQDAGTLDLLGLLYAEMERELRRDAPAAELLARLQLPVARAALKDRGFFVRARHPARELLSLVADAGAAWNDESENEPQLLQKLRQAVETVVREYDGNDAVFEAAQHEVQEHLRTINHRAEVAERRQVEAARGRDRMQVAKQQAATTLDAALEGFTPPRFVQALLQQAWADVLTLTLLRQGEDSEEWQERVATTRRIVEIAAGGTSAAPDPSLAASIETALRQVGYHDDEAGAIARRLASMTPHDEVDAEPSELAARLDARARLGEEQQAAPRAQAPARTEEEEAHYAQLRTLPFGTWFDFIINQQGDAKRQRLSWFSPVTDHALFVNRRGQRVGEHTLDHLARLMARGQLRIVTEDKGRLIDRAWQATVRALRSLSGSEPAPADADSKGADR